MIVEQRTYTVQAGNVPKYLSLYEAIGFPVQTRHLGQPVGYYSSEIGELNQIIHMWRYNSLEDRQKRRASLFADPEWKDAVDQFYGLITRMENKILTCAPFFTLPPA